MADKAKKASTPNQNADAELESLEQYFDLNRNSGNNTLPDLDQSMTSADGIEGRGEKEKGKMNQGSYEN